MRLTLSCRTPLCRSVMVVDALSNTLGGICAGLGLQRYAAAAQLAGYYAVGLPLGVGVAFGVLHGAEEGVYWLVGGVALAMLTAALVQLLLLCRTDWALAAAAAAKRLSSETPREERGEARGEEGSFNSDGVAPLVAAARDDASGGHAASEDATRHADHFTDRCAPEAAVIDVRAAPQTHSQPRAAIN